MLGLGSPNRIYVSVAPTDMRKQFDSLWALAKNELKEDPFSGALFVFTNKNHTRLKMLWWDGTGVWVFAKRLEKGRFTWPKSGETTKISLTPEALTMMLAGIDLRDGCRKAWYERAA